jgi:molybdenum cofactor synthesis domain-containing protein
MPIRAAILTVSDKGARGERPDTAGPAVAALLTKNDATVVETAIVPDEAEAIASRLRAWADGGGIDLILTAGGTGLASRDITPEATLAVLERQAPGIPEVMRTEGRKSTELSALSRAVAGTRGRTLIVNLPGSERGAVESLTAVLPLLAHAAALLQGETERHPVDG